MKLGYKMGIVRIGGRGTTRRVVDKVKDNWSGSAFKEYEKTQQEAAKDEFITVGRGTTRIKFGEIHETKTPDTKGMWVSSGRGTKRRKL